MKRFMMKRSATCVALENCFMIVVKKEHFEIIKEIFKQFKIEQKKELYHLFEIFPELVNDVSASSLKIKFIHDLS